MKDHRIFERFGFNLPECYELKERRSTILNRYQEWSFDLKLNDWIDSDNEEMLSGYSAPLELVNLLEYNIDTELE